MMPSCQAHSMYLVTQLTKIVISVGKVIAIENFNTH